MPEKGSKFVYSPTLAFSLLKLPLHERLAKSPVLYDFQQIYYFRANQREDIF